MRGIATRVNYGEPTKTEAMNPRNHETTKGVDPGKKEKTFDRKLRFVFQYHPPPRSQGLHPPSAPSGLWQRFWRAPPWFPSPDAG